MRQKTFFEKTLKSPLHFSGKGLFTGKESAIVIHPAETETGILFKKISGAKGILIPALSHNVHSASNRNTVLSDGSEDGVIYCVEHLMSALFGSGVTNAIIEVKGSEVPILDGSAKPFVDAILECGVVN